MSATISTHVLDTSKGMPASGVEVRLEDVDGLNDGIALAYGRTDDNGRLTEWAPPVQPGIYRLTFNIASYYGDFTFYPEVTITFRISDGTHHHVPLLISPFGYSTYRGS